MTLDQDGDGFDDGTATATTSTGITNYSLSAGLAVGANTLRVRASDSFGQAVQAQTVVNYDNAAPTVTSTSPAQNATVEADPVANLPVTVVFSEPMIASSVLSSLSVAGNLAPAITPLNPTFDASTNTLRFELSAALADTALTVRVADTATDLAGNGQAGGAFTLSFNVNRIPTITETSPADGEEMVGLAREAIVRFSGRIDPATITPASVKLLAVGATVPGRLVVSSTERFVTFYPDRPWEQSTEVRIQVDGDLIRGRNGKLLDADGDGVEGGKRTADFRTLPLTRIAGTNVFGFIYDSFNKNPDGSDRPIVGATVRLDAFPELTAVTDANGRFELRDMPAPEFFVHVDGTTATNAPAGFGYPSVGKPFHSVPGQTVQLSMDGKVFNVYLPPMAMADIKPLSPTAATDVGFGDAGKAQLQALFPDIDPAVWGRMTVTYPANSARSDDGVPATQATVIPVAPDRILAPLPPNLSPKLVVSIQAMDAQGREVTNFDVPAPVTFPNLEGLAPGEKSLIFSFNHDAGRWDIIGTGTVSGDGLTVVSDPGVGVRAPGWHFTQPGSPGDGDEPKDKKDPKWEDVARRLGDNYADATTPFPTRDAPLAHQLKCIAEAACAQEWGEGWIRDLFDDFSRQIEDPPPIQPSDFRPRHWAEHLCPIDLFSWLPIDAGDLCALSTGFDHFLDHLLPGFFRYCDEARSQDLDGNGRLDHEDFFQDAVVPCFDEVYQAGELSFLAKEIAQLVVPYAATASRELACFARDFLDSINPFASFAAAAPVQPPPPTREQLYSTDLANSSTLEVKAVGDAFFLQGGHTYDLEVYRRNPDGTRTRLNNSLLEFHAVDSDNRVTISSDGRLTVDYTGSPLAGYTPRLYVVVADRAQQVAGIGQFALSDLDTDGDLICDCHERLIGLDPLVSNLSGDADGDGLGDVLEAVFGSNPLKPDSDGDAFNDSAEFTNFTIPWRKSQDQYESRAGRFTFALENLNNESVLRGTTLTNGDLPQQVLAPRAAYRLVVFDPKSFSVGQAFFTAGASGVSFRLPDVVFDDSFKSADADGDGLSDLGEFAVGTVAGQADSDGDGIGDAAEIQQGLDPLDNRGFPTGIISSLPLQGQANEVVAEGSTLTPGGQTAYVATGSYGLAIVDTARFNNPIVLGQLDLPGDATDIAVDSNLGIAAVAANAGGLHFVSVADPMAPALLRTISVSTGQVEVVSGVAYVTAGTTLRAYDLLTGGLLQSLSLGGSTLTGLAREGTFLYTMDAGRRLRAIDASGFNMVARGTLTLPHGGDKLFVGNGVAYAPAINSFFRGGFATSNVSTPNSLTLISGSDVVAPFVAPGTAVAANGSGVAALVGSNGGVNSLDLMNVADPANTDAFLLRISLPTAPQSVSLASGIAFIADGMAGLQVVNYLPFDNRGQAPTVTASTTVADVDPNTPGIQVLEGTSIPVRAAVTDDVQVRNVGLLVDGQVVANDVSFPFDFFAVAPTITPGASTFTIQVRATDTRGNTALSNTIVIGLVEDVFAPTIASIEPPANATRVEPLQSVQIRFSESMAAATLTTQTVRVRDAGGNFLTPTSFQLRTDDRFVQLTFGALTAGTYQVVLSAAAITDRAGNALGSADIVSPFTLTARATLTTTAPDEDAGTPGFQVFEGTTLPLTVNLVAGVTAQRVEFLFDGQVVATATAAPYTASVVAPLIAPGVTGFTLQARVVDTAGLATLTDPLVVGLLEDVAPPTVAATDPPGGGSTIRGATSVKVIFTESMAVGSLSPAQFELVGAGPGGVFGDGNDVPVAVSAVQALNDDTTAQLTVSSLPLGPHRLRVLPGGLTDRAGNVLVTEFTSTFDVLDFIPVTITFNAGNGFPLSYTESGMTVTSHYPFGGPHVHLGDQNFDGSPDLLNHDGGTSTPYEFTFTGGAPFTFVSLRVVSHSGTSGFTSSSGAVVNVTGTGTINFPATGWTNVTSVRWDQFVGQTIIDDLMVLVRPGGSPLVGTESGSGGAAAVSLSDVRSLAAAAALWAGSAGLDNLPAFDVTLADLPGGQLGTAQLAGTTWLVTVDPDASGVGWFVDPTPLDNSEFDTSLDAAAFLAPAASPAAGHYDLFTVLLHEVGHAFGFDAADPRFAAHVVAGGAATFVAPNLSATLTADFDHLDEAAHPWDLMNEDLIPGVRKLPSALDVKILATVYPASAGPAPVLERAVLDVLPLTDADPLPEGAAPAGSALPLATVWVVPGTSDADVREQPNPGPLAAGTDWPMPWSAPEAAPASTSPRPVAEGFLGLSLATLLREPERELPPRWRPRDRRQHSWGGGTGRCPTAPRGNTTHPGWSGGSPIGGLALAGAAATLRWRSGRAIRFTGVARRTGRIIPAQ